MQLSDFLSELSQIQSLKALYVQNHLEGKDITQMVRVGWGRWRQEDGNDVVNNSFLLTNKGTAQHFGMAHDYTSVTKFVLNPPKGYLEGWDLWAKRPFSPADALASMTLVADDASPDSVMAVLLLLARIADVNVSEIPAAWIEAVDHWERAGISDDIWHSFCALESALAHRHFPHEGPITPESFSLGWCDALRFAAQCLALQLDPLNIPKLSQMREYVQARSALEQEQEVYWDWLQGSAPLQVSLPLEGATNRRMLVDGLIVEAQEITGSTKVFLRNDCGNSPLGRGFSFLALHIPASLGRDMEITLSVDPNRGVNLFKLWEAIERRETKAWEEAGEARPTKLPRKLEGADNIYEQPWYIDPTKTLLARPRALGNGHPGSRLEWKDIREILWQELNPLHGVSVSVPGTDTVLSLLDLNPEPGNPQHNKSFFAAKWVNIKGKDALLLPRTLLESKFLLRILAAMLHHRHPTRLIGYDDLPTHGSWDLVKLDGGLAIVNQDGVFILEDWSGKTLQISEIRSDFHCAATLDEEILHLEMNDLRPLVEDVQKLLNREHTVPGVDVLLLRSAHLGTRLAGLRGRYAVLPEDPEARLIRSAMEKRWSLDHRLSACEGETRAIETSLRSLSELSTLRIGRFIATYGFALVLATESCQFVSRAVYNLFQCSSTETDAPSLFNLGCFAVIAILLILGLRLWFTVERPLSRMITKEHQGR